MNKVTNTTQYIEQYFNSNVSFGNTSTCIISKNGNGFDQLILRIVLPKLPENVNYKTDCIYNLLKSIKVTIFDSTIFKYNSKQLKIIDRLTEKYYGETIEFCTLIDNVIHYPINLNKTFGESFFNGHNDINMLDLRYNGVRMCDFDNNNGHFKLIVKFNDILSIIDKESEFSIEEISKLQMVECDTLVRYTISEMPIVIPTNTIKQKLTLWNTSSLKHKSDVPAIYMKQKIDFNSDNYNNYYKIKKLVIKVNSDIQIKSFLLQINGYDCFSRINANTMKKIYEYNTNTCLDTNVYAMDLDTTSLSCTDNVIIVLGFNNSVTECDIDILVKTESYGTYKNGVFGKLCL